VTTTACVRSRRPSFIRIRAAPFLVHGGARLLLARPLQCGGAEREVPLALAAQPDRPVARAAGGLEKQAAGWTALVLSLLGLVSVAVSWSGL
jgi:hypothetical protein